MEEKHKKYLEDIRKVMESMNRNIETYLNNVNTNEMKDYINKDELDCPMTKLFKKTVNDVNNEYEVEPLVYDAITKMSDFFVDYIILDVKIKESKIIDSYINVQNIVTMYISGSKYSMDIFYLTLKEVFDRLNDYALANELYFICSHIQLTNNIKIKKNAKK